LPRLCLTMTMDCEEDDRLYRGKEKDPSPYVYICLAQHCGHYRNSLMHTLDYPPMSVSKYDYS